MKLNPKRALAVLLAAGTPAMAAIAPPSTGDGELFLILRDDNARVSYALDLGLTLDQFGLLGQQDRGLHRRWALEAANPVFARFLGSTAPAQREWLVMGADSAGVKGPAAGVHRWFTTARRGTRITEMQQMSNGSLIAGLDGLEWFTGFVNFYDTHYDRDSGSSTNYRVDGNSTNTLDDAGPVAYFGQGGPVTPDLNGNAPFQPTNAASTRGSAAGFYRVVSSSENGAERTQVERFGNADHNGWFTLSVRPDGGYELEYRLAPAQPGPRGSAPRDDE